MSDFQRLRDLAQVFRRLLDDAAKAAREADPQIAIRVLEYCSDNAILVDVDGVRFRLTVDRVQMAQMDTQSITIGNFGPKIDAARRMVEYPVGPESVRTHAIDHLGRKVEIVTWGPGDPSKPVYLCKCGRVFLHDQPRECNELEHDADPITLIGREP